MASMRGERRARAAGAWLLLAALAGCGAQPPAGDEVWAEVNGRPILRSQVEKYYQRQVGLQPEPPTAEEIQARKLAILNELIQDEILWQKAAQANLLATDGEVEARLEELRSTFSPEEFQQQLTAQGMTLEELKAELRREISLRKLLDKSLAAGLEVSDQEVTDFYEQHQNRFRFLETQYHVAQILVTPRPEPQVRNLKNDDAASDLEAQRKIQALLTRLRPRGRPKTPAKAPGAPPAPAPRRRFPRAGAELFGRSGHRARRRRPGILRRVEPGPSAARAARRSPAVGRGTSRRPRAHAVGLSPGEAARARRARPARTRRPERAADHPRAAAGPQAAIARGRLHRARPQPGARGQLPGAADPRVPPRGSVVASPVLPVILSPGLVGAKNLRLRCFASLSMTRAFGTAGWTKRGSVSGLAQRLRPPRACRTLWFSKAGRRSRCLSRASRPRRSRTAASRGAG